MTGKVIWSSNAPGKDIIYSQWSTPAPAIVDGAAQILFPGGDGALYAFEPRRGTQLWKVICNNPNDHRHWLPDSITAPPLVVGKSVIVSPALDHEMSGGDRRLVAIDLPSHKIRWAISPKGYNGTLGPMASDGGTIYAASRGGVVIAVDVDNGNVRWTRNLETGVFAGVCLHGGKLFLADDDGTVRVLSSRTGQIVDECALDEACVSTPVISGKNIYVVTRHYVWSLRLPD
jgi:outer membrane protein assembly factor BamB